MHTQHVNHPSFRASLTWMAVKNLADDSSSVKSYTTLQNGLIIEWSDGSEETFADPGDAMRSIRIMEEN